MKLNVTFLNGTPEQRAFVLGNAAKAEQTLSDPVFLAKVAAWPGFFYTDQTPQGVSDKLRDAGTVNIHVGFYTNHWTRAIAYESQDANGDKDVYINCAKYAYGAGDPGNDAHETMHALGFEHLGNAPTPDNLNSVPYRIGEWVDAAWAQVQA